MSSRVRPAPVEVGYKHMRFLIIHNPDKSGMDEFIGELKKRDIEDVVRVCEPTYDREVLAKQGIQVMDLVFDDGGVPSMEIIDKWVALLKKRFMDTPDSCVAVHCMAGLGRAPLLVALALMEAGVQYTDAVDNIRAKRRGAINQKQLLFLEKYRSKDRLRAKWFKWYKKNASGGEDKPCCIQ